MVGAIPHVELAVGLVQDHVLHGQASFLSIGGVRPTPTPGGGVGGNPPGGGEVPGDSEIGVLEEFNFLLVAFSKQFPPSAGPKEAEGPQRRVPPAGLPTSKAACARCPGSSRPPAAGGRSAWQGRGRGGVRVRVRGGDGRGWGWGRMPACSVSPSLAQVPGHPKQRGARGWRRSTGGRAMAECKGLWFCGSRGCSVKEQV